MATFTNQSKNTTTFTNGSISGMRYGTAVYGTSTYGSNFSAPTTNQTRNVTAFSNQSKN